MTLRPNRLCVYFFEDKAGQVDQYVLYLLQQIKSSFSRVVFVSGKQLNASCLCAVKSICNCVLEQERLDDAMLAYKFAMEHIGLDAVGCFDEVVLMDSVLVGPVAPLQQMFSQMSEADIWGLWEEEQPHFIALHKHVLESEAFRNSWTAPSVTGLVASLRDAGFCWSVFLGQAACFQELPFFSMENFTGEYSALLETSVGRQGRERMEYLKKMGYDVGMIWRHILRTANMADIRKCLTLDYVLPAACEKGLVSEKRIALVMHLYYPDLFEWCYAYALSMPPGTDLLLTTAGPGKKEQLQRMFSQGPWARVTVMEAPNTGRDVASLLLTARDYVQTYDFVCFVHDKKSSHSLQTTGEDFAYHCFENMLGSPEYVNNIIALFDSEPYLGLLSPPPPYHAYYYSTIGGEWGNNFEMVQSLAKRIGIHVDISPNKEPVAPLGTMFWFRPKALAPLFNYKWRYTDFPSEPIEPEGTILHAIERLYPFAAQQSGYYSAWCATDRYAGLYMVNYHHMLSGLNTQVFRLVGPGGGESVRHAIADYVDDSLTMREALCILKMILKKRTPKGLWKACQKVLRPRRKKEHTE